MTSLAIRPKGIEFVGAATGDTTATLPAHVAGDVIIAFAFRRDATAAPTLPSGWTDAGTQTGTAGGTNIVARLAYRTATGSSTASGTWTNATTTVFLAYRYAIVPFLDAQWRDGDGVSMEYANLAGTLARSFAVTFGCHASADGDIAYAFAPMRWDERAHVIGTGQVAAADGATGGGLSGGTTLYHGATDDSWMTVRAELGALHTALTVLDSYTVLPRARVFALTLGRAAGGGTRVLGDALEIPSALGVRAHVDGIGPKYLRLPGTGTNYASTPDKPALSLTNVDVRARIMPDSWASGVNRAVISQFHGTNDQRSWFLRLNASGSLTLVVSGDGAASTFIQVAVAVPFADGQAGWVRAAYQANSGSGQYLCRFYTSTDGSTWTQLGTDQTGASITLHDSTAPLVVGMYGNGVLPFPGRVYRAVVLNGVDGTAVADFDASLAEAGATSFTASTGETWTVHQAGVPSAAIVEPHSIAEAMTNAYDLVTIAEVADAVTTHEGMMAVDGIAGYEIQPIGVDALVTLRFVPTSAVIAPGGFVLAPHARGAVTGLTPVVHADDVPATAVTYDGQPVTYDGAIVTYGGA